jgi:hypothetical protein
MYINIIGFVGDEFKDPKRQKKALKEAEKFNKEQYKKYQKAQELLDNVKRK